MQLRQHGQTHCIASCSPAPSCPQLAAWGPAVCGQDPVVSALYSLFAAFAAEEQQLQQAGPLQSTAARRGLVNPSELRQALSALPGPQQYRVGECWGLPCIRG